MSGSVRGVRKHADRKAGRCALPLLYVLEGIRLNWRDGDIRLLGLTLHRPILPMLDLQHNRSILPLSFFKLSRAPCCLKMNSMWY
jgi:hypothetical protein